MKKEINVVDAGIIWIWQQKKLLISSALVFSRIRSAFLSQGDRNTIQQCLKTLPNGEKVRDFLLKCFFFSFCNLNFNRITQLLSKVMLENIQTY